MAKGKTEEHDDDKGKKSTKVTAATTEWLEGLFKKMNLNAECTAEVNEEGDVDVDLLGPDAEIFMQGKGKGLAALQTVAQQAVFANRKKKRALNIDVDGYRRNRVETLESLATVIGDKTDALSTPLTLMGMDSFERRAVHTSLAEDERFSTMSAGYGPFRRLKIAPK